MAIDFKTTGQKLAALTLAVAAGTFFLGMNLIYKPKQKAMKQIQVQRGGDQQKLGAIARIADAEKKIDSYRPRLAEKKESTWFIETLNDLADASGINLSLVTPLPRVPGPDFVKVPLRLEMSCDWHELGDFVARIENHSPLIRVETLRAEGQTDMNKPAQELRVSMTLAVIRPAEGPAA